MHGHACCYSLGPMHWHSHSCKWVARSLDIVMSLADYTTSALSSFWYLISNVIDHRASPADH
jgi:hypothetical protein